MTESDSSTEVLPNDAGADSLDPGPLDDGTGAQDADADVQNDLGADEDAALSLLASQPWKFGQVVKTGLPSRGNFLLNAVRSNPSVLSHIPPELVKRHLVLAALEYHDPDDVLRHRQALRYVETSLTLTEMVELIKRDERLHKYATLRVILQVHADSGNAPTELSLRNLSIETLRSLAAQLARDVARLRNELHFSVQSGSSKVASASARTGRVKAVLSREIRLLKVSHWRELRKLKSEHRNEMEKAKRAHSRELAQLELSNEQRVTQVRRSLAGEMKSVCEERDGFRRQVGLLEAMQGQSEIEKESSKRSISGLKQANTSLQARLDTAEARLRESRECENSLRSELSTMAGRVAHAEQEALRAEGRLDQARREAQNLRASLAAEAQESVAPVSARKNEADEQAGSTKSGRKPERRKAPPPPPVYGVMRFFNRIRSGST